MFTLKNIRYKNILAIPELHINDREITCIVGKSGGGKTTLLKLFNNMISPDEGSILYKNKSLTEYDPIALRREVMMLPQNPGLFSHTVKGEFLKTLEYTENPQLFDESQIRDLLNKVHLNTDLSAPTASLSGGEKQRLALARILLLNPSVLLLDEPSSALDDRTEEQIIEMVVSCIREKNKALVLVTHSENIAAAFGDTVITINKGNMDSQTTAGEVYGKHN
ncbi:MAG: ABC transporter ATP-binding protein [Fibrobacterota bacterium]